MRNIRKEFNLTQRELGKFLCFKPQFISLIENGHSKLPLEIVLQLTKHPALKKNKKEIKKRFLYSFVDDYSSKVRKVLK